MRKSSFATTSSQSSARAPRIEGSLPAKTDRFPRKGAPVGLLMTIKEKIKAQQR